MKKALLLSLSFAFAAAGLSGTVFAGDQAQEAYDAYNQKIAPIEQQLYAKQAELDAVHANPQPDTAKAQQLYREIGELRGQLFAADAELRSRIGDAGGRYAGMHHPGEFDDPDVPYAGMHHRGEFSQSGYGYRGHRGGYRGHGGGHHGGW